ncbi:MAG: hypothetical protein E3J64_00195 [Anaerolineales bacterium]|nr:MAG: hypothetical protein E3J64_00195 [Anaerolineales bacterium]
MSTTRKACLLLGLTWLLLACNLPLTGGDNGSDSTVTPFQAATDTPTASPTAEPTSTPADARTRIQFPSGAISAQVQGVAEQLDDDEYVLWAADGQTMSVALLGLPPEVLADQEVIIVIWGEDGVPLITDHAGANEWQGQLPVSQDYFIDVRSIAEGYIVYTLEVIIPPLSADLPTLQELGNCDYAWIAAQTITLVDGVHYVTPPGGEPPEDYTVRLRDVPLAYGDLDDDGDADAAVILVERAGGTGAFYYVAAVLNDSGLPHGVAVASLGDRVIVNTIGISDGIIAIEGVTHGVGDPSCCPTLEWIWEYELSGGALVEVPL